MIKSQALEANLRITKNVEFSIPNEHQWFLSLSEKHWGINQRAREFIFELNHPYSNRSVVIDLFTNISISDFAFYFESVERERYVGFLLDIFEKLIDENLSDQQSKQLIYLFFEFFIKNHQDLVSSASLTDRFFDIYEKAIGQKSFYFLSNISGIKTCLLIARSLSGMESRVLRLAKELALINIRFWKDTNNLAQWEAIHPHGIGNTCKKFIAEFNLGYDELYDKIINADHDIEELLKYTLSFSEIIEHLRKYIYVLDDVSEQIAYIFYLLNLKGAKYNEYYLLLDLNKIIRKFSKDLNETECKESINELFQIFEKLKGEHLNTLLDTIVILGKEIIGTQNDKLIHFLQKKIIRFGFCSPGLKYITKDLEVKINPLHIKSIRSWLELIEQNPEKMQPLLFALIINLKIGGIFIFDTDLFQKDVTKLLNSNIPSIYKPIKQLLRTFPVYFNEIGAEGLLRTVSTQIDEITHRNDKLIHFLRKQVHTEGNNSHIEITKRIIQFWHNPDIENIVSVIPQNVIEQINPKGEYVLGVHEVLKYICEKSQLDLNEILDLKKEAIDNIFEHPEHDSNDITRVKLIIELYQLLKEKYLLDSTDIIKVIKRPNFFSDSDIELLESHLQNDNAIEALKCIYRFMIKLNEIIFDKRKSEGWENIYYKRHVAFGIPSMYGEYHEPKFEAMGLTFRLEKIASALVIKIVNKINTEYYNAKTLNEISAIIELICEGLRLDGVYDQGFDSNLKMFQYSLMSGSFNIRQYINIFQFMQNSIKEIIKKFFIRPYADLLEIVISQTENKKESGVKHKTYVLQQSEMFYRDLISSAFLIQILDNFIGDILTHMRKQSDTLTDSEIQSIMTYNPETIISPLYHETPPLDNQVFLGSKAYYLKKLYINQFPVPPGFVITTEVFRRLNSILKIPSLNSEIDDEIRKNIKELEKLTGKYYGDRKNPLLLSVRSGSAISMPGAMNTFLNVGLNDEITESLSKQENFAWTSWDCYRRLIQTWGMSNGLLRNDFDNIMLAYKEKCNVNQKIEFSPQTMREIAFAYKKLLSDNQISFEQDPFLQIKKAIISVFNSWYTPRAQVYRKNLQIADEWGTAVIVQQMIFGNLHRESGSGVVFTRDTHSSQARINLNGDFSFLSQGEDIVSGLIKTLPISEMQKKQSNYNSPYSLEKVFPRQFEKLKNIAQCLIDDLGFSHQEIEFTFETAEPEDLYILQTRDISIQSSSSAMVFDVSEKKMEKVGCGIGINQSVLNGVVVFDQSDLEKLQKKTKMPHTILVRPDTVPDDIELIFTCDGLLTSRGGATSHAAVTAASLGKMCVVNCDNMVVDENEKKCIINGYEFRSFDKIAIDGRTGNVFKGNYPVKKQEL